MRAFVYAPAWKECVIFVHWPTLGARGWRLTNHSTALSSIVDCEGISAFRAPVRCRHGSRGGGGAGAVTELIYKPLCPSVCLSVVVHIGWLVEIICNTKDIRLRPSSKTTRFVRPHSHATGCVVRPHLFRHSRHVMLPFPAKYVGYLAD